MGRSRSKSQEAEATGEAEAAGASDQIVAAEQSAPIEAPRQREPGDDDEQLPADGEPTASHASRLNQSGEGRRPKYKDPKDQASVAIADGRDAPRLRILRQDRFNNNDRRPPSMWLQFDENPGREITDQLKDVGFRWDRSATFIEESGKEHRGAWVKPLEEGQEWRVQAEAERLFRDLGNQIRERQGLEPSSVMQGASQGV